MYMYVYIYMYLYMYSCTFSSFLSCSLPLEGMKRKIMRNLRTLETENMVNSKNDYQEIINAIAKVSYAARVYVHV